jgi:hypothetical protein
MLFAEAGEWLVVEPGQLAEVRAEWGREAPQTPGYPKDYTAVGDFRK